MRPHARADRGRAVDSRPSTPLTPSLVLLAVVNLIPLAGVLVWDWSVFAILLLFWMENVVYGLFNVLRILTNQGGRGEPRAVLAEKIATALFFTVHYGMFTAVHGVFVLVMFGPPGESVDLGIATLWAKVLDYHLQWVVLAMIVSHGFSFFESYIGKGEYRTLTVKEVMTAPYHRVMVMHVTILGGGFLLLLLNEPKLGVVLLVVLKTLMDIRGHRKAHRDSIQSAVGSN